jgi:hypothetical protein
MTAPLAEATGHVAPSNGHTPEQRLVTMNRASPPRQRRPKPFDDLIVTDGRLTGSCAGLTATGARLIGYTPGAHRHRRVVHRHPRARHQHQRNLRLPPTNVRLPPTNLSLTTLIGPFYYLRSVSSLKLTRNSVRPGRDSTSISPSLRWRSRRTMSRPSPVPCPTGFVVKNGSKIRP